MEIRLIDIGSSVDHRGQINFLDVESQLPFQIKNVFFIKNVPRGESRGNHANLKSHEFLIAIQGSIKITLNKKDSFVLNTTDKGLFVPSNTWIELKDFTDDAVCLVLSSDSYDFKEKITNG